MFDCRAIEVLDSESESKFSVWFVVATVVVVVVVVVVVGDDVVVVEDSVAGTSRYVTTNGLCPNSLIAFTRNSSRVARVPRVMLTWY